MKKFKLSFEDYYQAQKLFLGWKRWFFEIVFLISGLVLGLSVLMIVNALEDNDLMSAPFLIPILVIAALVVLATAPLRQKKCYKKIYDTQKSFQEAIKITFTDKNIEWKSESGFYKLAWKDVYKYKCGKNMIIISEGQNLMRIIPDRAFENSHEKEHLLRNLSNNAKTQ